jgi:hypothetical protein
MVAVLADNGVGDDPITCQALLNDSYWRRGRLFRYSVLEVLLVLRNLKCQFSFLTVPVIH